ncbi:Vacuolar protein sorting-associated protein [Parasponia andersonii]|uniref:Vacuolar protein sorting-associated protein n=1 Tax=Parasponia andersonii TaxID=3476 RepID=A0A2P5DY47_PARAD|nr:Vacuolar protein sorting-associated protein [Parasponia andersonii]
MLDFLFGWRKASKCKKLIKQVQCRLKLLKNKRQAIVRQLREDVAQLIKIGHENIALNRVEQLIEDETVVAAYELLDHFCEFIIIESSYIRRHRDCPNDVNEAISSLIYASARCGDLPELLVIRKLFEERYGQKFAKTALELLPGNLVNRQVKEKLSMQSVSEDMKQRMVNEIAKDYCLRTEILALEYYSDWQEQMKGSKDVQTPNGIAERSKVGTPNAEIERKVAFVDAPLAEANLSLTKPCSSNACEDRVITSNSVASSTIQPASPTVSESLMYNKVEKTEASAQPIVVEQKEERVVTASSSESFPKIHEETLVYLDDIEEFQSSTTKDEDSQDQRLFKFKSSVHLKKENFQNDSNHYSERFESWNEKEKPVSKDCHRSSSLSSRKRSKRRLVFQEDQSKKDTECFSYYGQPDNQRVYHQQRNQHKKTPVEGSERRLNQFCSSEMGVTYSLSRNRRFYPKRSGCSCCSNHKMRNSCSLESPCYFFTDDDDNDCDVPPFVKLKNFPRRSCREHFFWNEELDDEIEWIAVPHKPRRRSCDNGAMLYDVFTYPGHQTHSQSNELKGMEEEFGARRGRASSCRTRKDSAPPYLRNVTMPQERPKDNSKDDFQRSKSFPAENSNHVHPKLPDYDDITARFMALKKENQLTKLQYRKQQL